MVPGITHWPHRQPIHVLVRGQTECDEEGVGESAGRLQGQELKARQGPHETTTPKFPETQAERPAVLPDSQRVKVGQLSWVGSGRERLVSRKRVGESNSWAGSSHRWVGVREGTRASRCVEEGHSRSF